MEIHSVNPAETTMPDEYLLNLYQRMFGSREINIPPEILCEFLRNGLVEAQQHIGVDRREITHRLIPKEFDGSKIFQVADTHFSDKIAFGQKFRGGTDAKQISDIIAVEAKPNDLLVFIGDAAIKSLLSSEKDLDVVSQACRSFANLNLRKIFTLGNHEYCNPKILAAILKILAENGFEILRDKATAWERDTANLPIFGTEDWACGNMDMQALLAWREINRKTFGIILSHNADWLGANQFPPEALGSGLIVSGHTHGGIINHPLLKKLDLWRINYQSQHYSGFTQVTENLSHNISNGVGYTFPLRYGVPPEISVITLHSAA